MRFQLASCVKLKMNVLVRSVSQKRKSLKQNRPKNQNSNKFSNSLAQSRPEIHSSRQNSQIERFVENRLCFKWRQKYGLQRRKLHAGRVFPDKLSTISCLLKY